MSYGPFGLEGKVILITGASSGIGRSVAVEASKAGAKECILVGRSEDKLVETASLIGNETKSTIIVCDVTDYDSINTLVDKCPIIDGAILNAGVNKMRPISFVNENDFEMIFDVNCFSSVILTKQLVKRKKLRNPSSIVYTSSISGYSNYAIGNAIYGMSKNALSTFMKYSAVEFASRGIRFNAVLPGRIETPLIHSGLTDDEAIAKDKTSYPLKRYGLPEEVAYAMIYLLSDASAWVTGTEMVIDGGRSLV